jgi:hypothetical protein
MALAPQSTVDEFWLQMGSLYGDTWPRQFGESPRGPGARGWAIELGMLTPEQIRHGLAQVYLAGGEWPPSAPGFRRMALGIPRFGVVRLELRTKGSTRSPFTLLTWSYLDGYLFARASNEDADRQLREAYAMACDHVLQGGALPEERLELGTPEPRKRHPASDECARRYLQAIADMLAGSHHDEDQP